MLSDVALIIIICTVLYICLHFTIFGVLLHYFFAFLILNLNCSHIYADCRLFCFVFGEAQSNISA